MSSIGTGYDLFATTFSPDGRVFQVEYATKAVENSGTAIGLRVKDGVVLGVEKLILSKMLVEGSNRRIHTIDKHAGLVFAGLSADARQLVNRSRDEASNYRTTYGSDVPAQVLANRVASFTHAHTLYWSLRPFGASVLMGVYDADGPQLYCVEPSGSCYNYFGCAVGKGKQAAKVEIEKLDLANMTARQAVVEVAKIIYSVHDEVKDKAFELELSWVCDESNRRHQLVPKDLLQEAEKQAKEALQEDMDDE
eukprot:JP446609.1.p1 GENE.JP446609.1~~JP446609.1.p1  ORF type:complete len:251 (+),score=58.56 JP446609.1:28-780(+)